MFSFKDTERYNVKTKAVLTEAIHGAYMKSQAVLPKEAPDVFLLITSILSLGILIFMTILTALKEAGTLRYVWFVLSGTCVLFLALTIARFFKNLDAYKKDAGAAVKLEKKTAAFLNLFDADSLPEEMSASDLAKKVSSLLGKQSDNIFNNALRDLASSLNSKNNPPDVLCKNLTPVGERFPESRQRFYFKKTENGYVFYDSDFSDPRGEFLCDFDDLLAYGFCATFSDSDRDLFMKSGKVRQDSCIMKVSDGSEYYFFEFSAGDYDKIRKTLPSRKEL